MKIERLQQTLTGFKRDNECMEWKLPAPADFRFKAPVNWVLLLNFFNAKLVILF